jgi:NADH:ubiquinone reductase (H+-translocating)
MKKIVIIGGGFGGICAAKEFGDFNADITLIDKTNYHLFQPLLYQVATAALSPADIATPIRAVLNKYKNITVVMDEVTSVDRSNRKVITKDSEYDFDYLIIATGSRHTYFGKDEWEKYAPGLKTLNDALNVREKILRALETAEITDDKDLQKKYLTYVVVGGGPTGVEMAGAIAEIVKISLMKDFRNFKAEDTKVYLIEALPRLLSTYPEDLSEKAKKALESLGVEVLLNTRVTDVDNNGVKIGERFIETTNIIWAAGNSVSPLLKTLDTELDKEGRAFVNPDLSIKGDPNIFVIGDAVAAKDKNGDLLPGIAPVAMQQGRYAARIIKEGKDHDLREPFVYFDKGTMATIGRAKAVAVIGRLKFSGLFAWLLWCVIHIFYLITFRNRFRVMAEWMWYYITFRHGIRLITGHPKNIKQL